MSFPEKNSNLKFRRAIYPGTFDPPTNGHYDIATRASLIFDEIVVAASENSPKNTLFTVEERLIMLREVFSESKKVVVKSFSSLLVDFAKSEGAIAIVRGLRAVSDFDYELQMASLNFMLNNEIETVFFMASDENLFVSSSVIKEIAKHGGDVSSKVHPFVAKMLKKKFKF